MILDQQNPSIKVCAERSDEIRRRGSLAKQATKNSQRYEKVIGTRHV